MRRNITRHLVAFAGAVCAFAVSERAEAYNNLTHQRIIEAAVEVMLDADRAPVPAGVDAAEWRAYTARVVRSAGNLRLLRTGLFGVYRFSTFPGPPSTLLPTAPGYNDPEICSYHGSHEPGRDLNLLNVLEMRISEFPYYPNKDWGPCAYTPIDRVPSPPLGGSLGPVLGWHAQNVDNWVSDSILWSRPTNAGIAGLTKEATNRVVEYGFGALLIPFVCLANLIFGDGCDIDDSFDLVQRINPVTLIEGTLPGVGDVRGPDYVGLWHFIDVGATSNRYNDVRGLFYEQAGPSYPGAVDVAIMAVADLSGLSLNAFAAEGPERYGAFDRVERTPAQWQAHSIGHTEFSPLDNLARSGWGAYESDPTDAAYLSAPLHAVGDAAAPHHVTGTTSWGHRPFEEAVDSRREEVLPRNDRGTFTAFRDRVLRIGFDAVRPFDADRSIQAFIEREARATRKLAETDGDWVFQDGASIEALVGSTNASEKDYKDQLHRSRPFVELGVGYAVALLARAGDLARDPGMYPETLCPPNSHFTGEGTGCAEGPAPPPPKVEPLPPGVASVSCLSYAAECRVSAECCNEVPCTNGRCRYP